MAEHANGILVLQKHFVHFDFQLVRLKVDRAHQLRRLAAAEAAAADGIVDGTPAIKLQRVRFADLLQRGGTDSAGDFGKAGEPLLLQAADKGLIVPAQVGDHDDIAAGDIAAHIAIAFHEDDVLGACAGCGNGCGVARGTAAHYQNVTLGIYRNFTVLFQISFHQITPFQTYYFCKSRDF